MQINRDNQVSMTEANQDFSRLAHMVDETGPVVITQNNAPRYLLLQFQEAQEAQTAGKEEVLAISQRLIAQNREAYEVLAK